MFNRVSVKAWFTGCNIKAGKTTMQFELDQEYKATLPDLALLTGQKVQLAIDDEQQVLFVNRGTGECFDDECEEFADDEAAEGEGPFDDAA